MKKRKLKRKYKIFIAIFFILFLILISILFINNKKTIELESTTSTNKNTSTTTSPPIYEVNTTFVGDLLFEQPYYNSLTKGDSIDTYFNRVKKYFEEDDLSIGNMEVIINNSNLKESGSGFSFCAPKYIGDLVNTLDFQVLSTANNHAFDRGVEGIKSSISYFKENTDIMTIGTNDTGIEEEHILEINNIKFGFLAYTYGTNTTPSEENQKYISYYRNLSKKEMTEDEKEKIKKQVENLKNKTDIIIVVIHWGKEFQYEPTTEQKEIAKYLNSLGVDIIIGSHSHCIEPIEELESDTGYKTLVFYSLGNFVSADDDISRTPKGEETFDNAYQVGLLANLKITKENDNITITNIKTKPIINYFDKNMRNFELIPYEDYTEEYETNHYRYKLGLTKEFIDNMYNNVIDQKYH